MHIEKFIFVVWCNILPCHILENKDLNMFAAMYINDIFVTGKTDEEHHIIMNLEKVFACL